MEREPAIEPEQIPENEENMTMKRPIAIAIATAAFAVGGTAIAAPGGPGGLLGGEEDRQAEFA